MAASVKVYKGEKLEDAKNGKLIVWHLKAKLYAEQNGFGGFLELDKHPDLPDAENEAIADSDPKKAEKVKAVGLHKDAMTALTQSMTMPTQMSIIQKSKSTE